MSKKVNVKSKNSKRSKKARIRYDRVAGLVLIAGISILGVSNVFSNNTVFGATTTSEAVVKSVKQVAKNCKDEDIYKTKVDFNKDNGEVTVNLIMGTSYYELPEVSEDGYKVAKTIVNMLEEDFDGEITACNFDIDVKVLMNGYSVEKRVADFKVEDMSNRVVSTYNVDEFRNNVKIVKDRYQY